MSYSIGDEVECINNTGVESFITTGTRYTVTGVGDEVIRVRTDDGGSSVALFSHRFKPVSKPATQAFSVGDKVICIDAKGIDSLTHGNVYTVSHCWHAGVNLKETGSDYYGDFLFAPYSLEKHLDTIEKGVLDTWGAEAIRSLPSGIKGGRCLWRGWELTLTKVSR